MIVLRNPSEVAGNGNPFIRQLLALRFRQLNLGDCPDASGSFIVVEAGDSIDQLEHEAGLPILHGLFDDLPYGHPDFSPCFEILEEHCNEQYTDESCTDGNDAVYEMVFISNDDGAFTCLFIADTEGIDANLLAMCQSFAIPAEVTLS
jgi:hypothetical protein